MFYTIKSVPSAPWPSKDIYGIDVAHVASVGGWPAYILRVHHPEKEFYRLSLCSFPAPDGYEIRDCTFDHSRGPNHEAVVAWAKSVIVPEWEDPETLYDDVEESEYYVTGYDESASF